MPEHFGMLHAKNLTPHRAIWTLAAISAVVGCIAVLMLFGDAGAPTDAAIKALPQGFLSSFGYTTHDKMAALPNSLLTITLASNFGTFLLYMLSCITCIVGLPRSSEVQLPEASAHPDLRAAGQPGLHGVLPDRAVHGLTARRWSRCWRLGIAAVWGIYGGIYFVKFQQSDGPDHDGHGRAPG